MRSYLMSALILCDFRCARKADQLTLSYGCRKASQSASGHATSGEQPCFSQNIGDSWNIEVISLPPILLGGLTRNSRKTACGLKLAEGRQHRAPQQYIGECVKTDFWALGKLATPLRKEGGGGTCFMVSFRRDALLFSAKEDKPTFGKQFRALRSEVQMRYAMKHVMSMSRYKEAHPFCLLSVCRWCWRTPEALSGRWKPCWLARDIAVSLVCVCVCAREVWEFARCCMCPAAEAWWAGARGWPGSAEVRSSARLGARSTTRRPGPSCSTKAGPRRKPGGTCDDVLTAAEPGWHPPGWHARLSHRSFSAGGSAGPRLGRRPEGTLGVPLAVAGASRPPRRQAVPPEAARLHARACAQGRARGAARVRRGVVGRSKLHTDCRWAGGRPHGRAVGRLVGRAVCRAVGRLVGRAGVWADGRVRFARRSGGGTAGLELGLRSAVSRSGARSIRRELGRAGGRLAVILLDLGGA